MLACASLAIVMEDRLNSALSCNSMRFPEDRASDDCPQSTLESCTFREDNPPSATLTCPLAVMAEPPLTSMLVCASLAIVMEDRLSIAPFCTCIVAVLPAATVSPPFSFSTALSCTCSVPPYNVAALLISLVRELRISSSVPATPFFAVFRSSSVVAPLKRIVPLAFCVTPSASV